VAKKLLVKWKETAAPAENARTRLSALIAEYFADGRRSARPETNLRELRRFAMRTERVRCTLELFRGCYGPGLEERIARLRELEDRLAKVNDCDAALRLALDTMAASPQRSKIENLLTARAERQRTEFLRHWRETFDKPGLEQWWSGYLARNTRSTA
jgi:CHAD domain-containing protein